ncbi:methyltransferase [Herbiconiux sp. A18JL235]|uniref:Methyltransferase n=1 Tax=Herbiconiux sp. A18JL235 TaxID=3152363 RepID=A0AB39BED6_9MICO
MDHVQHLIDLLRDDLTAGRYRVDLVDGLWGDAAAAALFRGQTEPAVRALDAGRASGTPSTPVESFARLFLLGQALPIGEVAAAFPRLRVAGAEELGLVVPAGGDAGRMRAALDLRPYSFVDTLGAGSWWVVSDLGEAVLGRALDKDHVLGIGGASTTLSGLMIPTPVDSVLDLGTGCGIQAMHASRHARRVVATDISQRALDIARLNARLNGIESIEFRHGSLFEPVAGERFDRIVSNPPFVITPRVDGVPLYEYRDGGLVGDALVERVVREAADHLTPGGIAQLLGNWEYRAAPPGSEEGGSDGLERVRSWVESGGAELDAWVVERERQDAPSYAETWIRDGGTRPGTPEFAALYGAWLDDFDARGVREVGFGYVLLRRPAEGARATASAAPTPAMARYERVAEAVGSNPAGLGAHLEACLAGHDWQAHRDDDALLASTLVYASDVTEERHYWPGHDDPVVMTLRQGGGFARTAPLDTALAAFVGACDGDLSVRALCAALAEVLGVDESLLVADLLPAVRALVSDAFLLPAG